MKLDRPDIKPLTVGAPAFSAGVSTSSLGKAADGSSSSSSTTSVTVESTKDGTYKHENPFLQFLSGTQYVLCYGYDSCPRYFCVCWVCFADLQLSYCDFQLCNDISPSHFVIAVVCLL